MNRREALRSLAGGCAAGALAAAGVSVALPVSVADETSREVTGDAEIIERFLKLPEPEQTAILALMDADVHGADPTEAVYEALGKERGEFYIRWWCQDLRHGPKSWFTAEVE